VVHDKVCALVFVNCKCFRAQTLPAETISASRVHRRRQSSSPANARVHLKSFAAAEISVCKRWRQTRTRSTRSNAFNCVQTCSPVQGRNFFQSWQATSSSTAAFTSDSSRQRWQRVTPADGVGSRRQQLTASAAVDSS